MIIHLNKIPHLLKLVENVSLTSGRIREHSGIYFTTPARALGAQELFHWKTEYALKLKGKIPVGTLRKPGVNELLASLLTYIVEEKA